MYTPYQTPAIQKYVGVTGAAHAYSLGAAFVPLVTLQIPLRLA